MRKIYSVVDRVSGYNGHTPMAILTICSLENQLKVFTLLILFLNKYNKFNYFVFDFMK